ncbi:DEAD/DEAH box helicase [Dyadobacter fermentans]|uniref:DEAD/DEAH box helicase n=1 Tax=Dyadobacter fermentans TaxID=94254 RepID=UPI001CBEC2D1|nr:DEAD/DEAH box helicase [Dyadobacter fermentans]MBZ1361995.1 DEAD/DEAH box helicase [Dyadobacter fermentans]
MKYTPRPYQAFATKQILDNEVIIQTRGAGLFLDMGLGKTISTLTAINELIFDRLEIKKVLIIAPKRVAEHTWTEEIRNWDHVKHLITSVCIGSEKQRIAALKKDADVYTINRENVPWLVAQLGSKWPFDMVVIDELSSFKNPSSARFKALKLVRPLIKRIVGLTGTPAPNNLLDLWSQVYLLDRGERLGKTIGNYRQKYFSEGRRNGHVVYEYNLRQSSDELLGPDINEAEIYDKISDICISMKAEDWLDLPPRIDNDLKIAMPPELKAQYNEFEKKSVMQLDDEDISAVNAAALTNKLLQFSNGAVYREDKTYYETHDLKIDALEECLEAAAGNPVLVFYNFKHDVVRIKEKLKKYKPHELGGAKDIDRWNKGEIPFLLAHPASAGHGLNMQRGGNRIVWFGLPWSLELYQQAVARLDRQGQTQSVINTHIICADTMDEDVVKGLKNKAWGQEQLMQAIKAKINKYNNH